MNTLKHLIRNISVRLYGTSALDGIVAQGFKAVDGDGLPPNFRLHLPEDCELYGKGNERILYNGKTDRIIKRYNVHR